MAAYILCVSNKQTLPSLAQNIRQYRNALGWSQTKLGEKLGYTQQLIVAYENGTRVPPPATLAKMADIFKTSIDLLVGKRRTKRQPAGESKVMRKLRIIEKLPATAQKNIIAMVEELARAHNIVGV